MADDDDYLSDKFLASGESTTSQPTTYAERRKQERKESQLKNDRNRLKSRRKRELDSREEGLGKSLFQRAQEEAVESGKQNKALAIMMKMGFQPGQSLGSISTSTTEPSQALLTDGSELPPSVESGPRSQHRVEPLPINEWTGKTGIGGIKRPPSPSTMERVSKVARQAEQLSADEFRDRARQEYEERRAEGRLRHVQNTCITLDTEAGIQFNRYWLNPTDPESLPPGLLDSLQDMWTPLGQRIFSHERGDTIPSRLRSQMQADALQPLSAEPSNERSLLQVSDQWTEETLKHITVFLHMNAPDRLMAVVSYLRDTYNYCFWCGTQYANTEEMNEHCPGQGEDLHD